MAHSLHARGLGLASQQVWVIPRRSKISNRHDSSPHESFSQVRMDVVGIETFVFDKIAPFALRTSFSTSKSTKVCPRVTSSP